MEEGCLYIQWEDYILSSLPSPVQDSDVEMLVPPAIWLLFSHMANQYKYQPHPALILRTLNLENSSYARLVS